MAEENTHAEPSLGETIRRGLFELGWGFVSPKQEAIWMKKSLNTSSFLCREGVFFHYFL